jgi:hypothetical protein
MSESKLAILPSTLLYTCPGQIFRRASLTKSHPEKRKTMSKRSWSVFAGVSVLVLSAACALPSAAQSSEVKEKPPMYSYIANWQIPRAQWGEMEKSALADNALLDKALADGTIVAYGNDENLVHQPDGETHDDWWSSMSMAGLIKVLDQLSASGSSASSVLTTSTRHWDEIMESRYYNWHSGSWKTGYTSVSSYKLKPDAPDDAIDLLSQNMVVPLLEKMLSDGTIHEYEIDTQAIHTEAPDTFWIVYIASSPEGLDKVNAAIVDSLKTHPLSGPAFSSMIDFTAHRDELIEGPAKFK